MAKTHTCEFVAFHADYCHRYENGEMCQECGVRRRVESRARDFRAPESAWWHWGQSGCSHCEELMRRAGLDPCALEDENVACREIERQFAAEEEGT